MKLAILLALSVALVYGWDDIDNVIKFTALNRARPLPRRVQLKHFHFNDCGDKSSDLLVLKNVLVSPDPLVFPGNLNASFSADIKQTVSDKLSVSLLLKIKHGMDYVKLPCIADFGSCEYDDFCSILNQIPECPDAFIDNGIPCQCPFNQASYTLPPTEFNIGYVPIPSGDYMATAYISWKGNQVGCLNATLSFQ